MALESKVSKARGRPRRERGHPKQRAVIAPGQSFGRQLDEYLRVLDVTPSQLAAGINVQPGAVSKWLNADRTPAVDTILDIVRFLDRSLKENVKARRAGLRMDIILVSLMRACGFNVPNSPRDVSWDWARQEGARPNDGGAGLIIGWTPCPPLASDSSDRTQKIALEIALACARLMGLKGRIERPAILDGGADWEGLVSKLVAREIDVIAPILARSPHNTPQGIVFSEPVDLLYRHRLLARRATVQATMPMVLQKEEVSEKYLPQIRFLNVGEGVSSKIFARDAQNGVDAQSVPGIDEALKILLHSDDNDRIPMLVADGQSSIGIAETYKELVSLQPPLTYDVAFPLCFAVRQDEDRLLSEINLAITAMRDSGMLNRLIESSHDALRGFLWLQKAPPTVIKSRQHLPQFTHTALHVQNLEKSVAFYQRFCGLQVIGSHGTRTRAIWLGKMQDAREHVLVLLEGGDKHRQNAEDLTHLGFAVDDPAEIDRIAEEGRREDCLHWAPRNLGPPAGKLCALRDPTGHIIEFSFGQSCGPS